MLKILPFLVVVILVLSGLGAVAFPEDKQYNLEITESLHFSNPEEKNMGEYSRVNLDEATSYLMESGKPFLPVVTKVYTFPIGTKIKNVMVVFSEVEEQILSKPINPAPKPVYRITAVDVDKELEINETIYSSSELYPDCGYSYRIGAGLDNSKHVIFLAVRCHPIRYSPAENTIHYANNADIKISYEEPAKPILFPDEYDMVIIAPKKFSTVLQPLIEHKNSHNVRTIMKTTGDIYSNYIGRDNAEQIKYFIKDAIEEWNITYVLLVGNIKKLPIRTTHPFPDYYYYFELDILSDLYYADIYDEYGDFCDWDANHNNIFGECYYFVDIDGVDLYPDVNVGRLACNNLLELSTVVNKIINYEERTNGQSWFNRLILCGGDTHPGWNGYEGEITNDVVAQNMPGFTPIRLWTSENTFNPKTINHEINTGAGFVDYSGHGFEIGLGTHPPNDESWIDYNFYHLFGLINRYKLPIVFFDACSTAKLDFTIGNLTDYLPFQNIRNIIKNFHFISSQLFPCFAWYCVKKPFGGAIATIGATQVAYSDVDEDGVWAGAGYLAVQFFKAYEEEITVSQMLTRAQNDYINNVFEDYLTLEEFLLLGDPSLMVGGYK